MLTKAERIIMGARRIEAVVTRGGRQRVVPKCYDANGLFLHRTTKRQIDCMKAKGMIEGPYISGGDDCSRWTWYPVPGAEGEGGAACR